MENNDISLEIYVKDQKLNKNDYELIMTAINKIIELVPDNPLGIIEMILKELMN